MYEINKLQHGKCFVRDFHTRWFCITRWFCENLVGTRFPWSNLYKSNVVYWRSTANQRKCAPGNHNISGDLAARRAAKRSPISIPYIGNKRKPMSWFSHGYSWLAAFLVGAYARRRRRRRRRAGIFEYRTSLNYFRCHSLAHDSHHHWTTGQSFSLECDTTKPFLQSFRKVFAKMLSAFVGLVFVLIASLIPDASGKVLFIHCLKISFLNCFYHDIFSYE